jgi:hypothetical protein
LLNYCQNPKYKWLSCTATNSYDGLGRVSTQTVPSQGGQLPLRQAQPNLEGKLESYEEQCTNTYAQFCGQMGASASLTYSACISHVLARRSSERIEEFGQADKVVEIELFINRMYFIHAGGDNGRW